MASKNHELHFAIFPFMAQGHITPMIDIARLLAQRGIMITILTTPVNATRFKPILDRAVESKLPIQLLHLPFPSPSKTKLPEGCESLDMIPTSLAHVFFDAMSFLLEPADNIFKELVPKPTCIISDMCLPFTIHIAKKYCVPRISFNGFCCFTMLCLHNVEIHKVFDSVSSDDEYVVVPGLADKIKVTKSQLPRYNILQHADEFKTQVYAAEEGSYGTIFNSFDELEGDYVREYEKARGQNYKVWCVGPVSLCNKDKLDKVQRGNKASIEENECMKWLDSWPKGTLLYVCLGSLCNLVLPNLIQLALGLEESKVPFIWAMRGGEHNTKEFENWVLENGYEERVKGRCLLIKGWAPQILILSHPSIGGFLTHCGWNSTLEAICASVPMVTFPLFGDQFLNERFVVQVLRIGVRIGVDVAQRWGEEDEIGVVVDKEDVKKAIEKVMGEGGDKESMRERARNIGEMSKKALEGGGSSNLNITSFIEDIRQKWTVTSE